MLEICLCLFFNGRPGCKFPFEVVLSELFLGLASLPVILFAISCLSLSEWLRRLSWCGGICVSKKKKAKLSGDKHFSLRWMDSVTISVDLFLVAVTGPLNSGIKWFSKG